METTEFKGGEKWMLRRLFRHEREDVTREQFHNLFL